MFQLLVVLFIIKLYARSNIFKNEDYKILWDFSIQTDHDIEAQRPDLVVVDKKRRTCKIIDFAVPGESKIEKKEKEKIEK